MSGGNVARIESCDVTGINTRNFRKLAEVANVSVETLEARIGPESIMAADDDGVELVGEVTAGGLVESLVYDGQAASRLPMAFPGLERVYALRIRGDSMAPAYQAGEILIVQDLTPDELVDGEDAVIQQDGSGNDASTFKRVVFLGDGRLKLVPLNASYRAMECSLDSVVRIGRVLGKFTPAPALGGVSVRGEAISAAR